MKKLTLSIYLLTLVVTGTPAPTKTFDKVYVGQINYVKQLGGGVIINCDKNVTKICFMTGENSYSQNYDLSTYSGVINPPFVIEIFHSDGTLLSTGNLVEKETSQLYSNPSIIVHKFTYGP